MSTIDLDTLKVFVEAITESHNDVTPGEFILMIRKLDNAGYQITRKPPIPVWKPVPASVEPPPVAASPFAPPSDFPDEVPF